MLALLVLSAVYVAYGSTAFVTAVFAGLAPAVIAIVVQAVYRVGKRSLTHPALVVLAVAAFGALTFLRTPFPIVILAAGLFGWLAGRRFPGLLRLPPEDLSDGPEPLIGDDALHHERPSRRRSVLILVVGLVIWAAPVVVVALTVSSTTVFVDQALFFSGAAVVTFGGAYSVLSYVAQQAVHVYGWLTAGEMVSGLALAETTPGPLIMVVQFVAFLGAYSDPGALDPWFAAVLASLLVCWVTFVPCFLFVLLGAPYVERLRHNTHLAAALTGVTAAVVGVIANLAAFFALHTLFDETRHVSAGIVQLDVPVPRLRGSRRVRHHRRRARPHARPGLEPAPHARAVRPAGHRLRGAAAPVTRVRSRRPPRPAGRAAGCRCRPPAWRPRRSPRGSRRQPRAASPGR